MHNLREVIPMEGGLTVGTFAEENPIQRLLDKCRFPNIGFKRWASTRAFFRR
jgi:hypothetical protein